MRAFLHRAILIRAFLLDPLDLPLHNCAISRNNYSPVNKFYSFIIFSLLINAVILLFNCCVLILYRYIHFLYFNLNIIWTFI